MVGYFLSFQKKNINIDFQNKKYNTRIINAEVNHNTKEYLNRGPSYSNILLI